jgi:hypothetical protein
MTQLFYCHPVMSAVIAVNNINNVMWPAKYNENGVMKSNNVNGNNINGLKWLINEENIQ